MNTYEQINVLFEFVGLLIGLAIFFLSIEVITKVARWFIRGVMAWLSRNMPKTYEQLNKIGIK